MIHLSFLKIETLYPKIPINNLTKNNLEENYTPRVCFAPTIDHALMALGMNLKDKILFVYKPIKSNLKTVRNEVIQGKVPDAHLTKEFWMLEKTEMEVIAKVRVTEVDLFSYSYYLGSEKIETFRWHWNYI